MLMIHDTTKHALDSLMEDMPHAMLLSGRVGVGLSYIAKHYAVHSDMVTQVVLPSKDDVVDIDKGIITVEQVRDLYSSTRTREPKGRIVIIDYAERMGVPAQNAFLKLLEEPIKGTHFMLLSHTPERLLPTILSRAQHVAIRPIDHTSSLQLLDELGVSDPTKRTQLLFIAEGLPAELTRLAKDSSRFESRVAIVKDAREFIVGTPYAKLLLAAKYKDDRQGALLMLDDAARQLRQSTADKGDTANLRVIERIEKAHQYITDQGNVRLHLSAASLFS